MNENNKLIVIDLDGTLIRENSHLKVLNEYYQYNYLQKLIFKMYARVFPKKFQLHIDMLAERIPIVFIENVKFTYREDLLKILKTKNLNERVMIISNAPQKILDCISHRLLIPAIHTDFGKKANYIITNCKYDYLEVYTDSVNDIDIIELADKAIIYTNNQNEFKRFMLNNIEFREGK